MIRIRGKKNCSKCIYTFVHRYMHCTWYITAFSTRSSSEKSRTNQSAGMIEIPMWKTTHHDEYTARLHECIPALAERQNEKDREQLSIFLPSANCPRGDATRRVMRNVTRGIPAVSARLNSSAWRRDASRSRSLSRARPAHIPFHTFLPISPRHLSPPVAWRNAFCRHVTARTRRAMSRRSFCRRQLRDTKWAAHSVSHAARHRFWCARGVARALHRARMSPAGVTSHETVTWHGDVI